MTQTVATQAIAMAASGLLLVGAAFQLALGAGAPWAAAAFGARAALSDGRLPTRYRVASLVAAVVMIARRVGHVPAAAERSEG